MTTKDARYHKETQNDFNQTQNYHEQIQIDHRNTLNNQEETKKKEEQKDV